MGLLFHLRGISQQAVTGSSNICVKNKSGEQNTAYTRMWEKRKRFHIQQGIKL